MSSEKFQMLAKTFPGLEEVLKEELLELGASDVETVIRGVKFTGTKELLYKANFCCRTALRVLRIIGEYKVKNTNDLYQSVYQIDWSEIFDLSQSFAINSTVNSEAFNNSMFVSLKSKDAIVDQFRSKFKKRPSVNADDPDIRINVHASSDTLTVSLDSSGESLHKRGYRVGQNEASMSEVLAAGILKIAGWKGQTDFYDTMCGSGTIPVEAALIARNIPPGMFRQEFAFEKWKDFDAELLEEIYNADYEREFEHKIYASDISPINIKVSEKNAKSAGVIKDIVFAEKDFAQFEPESKSGLLIINPPYGERMRERMVEPLYIMIGDQLKKHFSGFKAWVFSSSEAGFKNIGLRPSQKIKMYNGPLECSFRLFELYEGSKKASKQDFQQRGSYKGSNERGDFKPRRSEGDFKARRSEGDYKPRRSEGDYKPRRSEGEFKPRRSEGDFKPRRSEGEFKPRRSEGDYKPRRSEGDFKPRRGEGDFKPRRSEGDFKPRRSEGDFKPRRSEGDFKPRRSEGEFKPKRSEGEQKSSQAPRRKRIEKGKLPDKDTNNE
ncbi:THUMP domain-containing class I SAM-dependent RNA methyltransferase [Roseimarinus sediminis]|jgi:putative N6-adenine-specific DNA methylase|uniref:THUMP domain-containing class I SAM-dependent RNA methyltransferase n=1 Tax=Roseimarinus sediminis TaxID=1610899 RepID=UPI003D225E6D